MLTKTAYSLEEIAEKYEMKAATLKTWCKNDLFSYDTEQNGRKTEFSIPEESLSVIEKIITLKKERPRITNDEIKSELTSASTLEKKAAFDSLTIDIVTDKPEEEEMTTVEPEELETLSVLKSTYSKSADTPYSEKEKNVDVESLKKIITPLVEKMKEYPTRKDVLEMIVHNDLEKFPLPNTESEISEIKDVLKQIVEQVMPQREELEKLSEQNKRLERKIYALENAGKNKENKLEKVKINFKNYLEKIKNWALVTFKKRKDS